MQAGIAVFFRFESLRGMKDKTTAVPLLLTNFLRPVHKENFFKSLPSISSLFRYSGFQIPWEHWYQDWYQVAFSRTLPKNRNPCNSLELQGINWRRVSESNRLIEVLQTSAFPLGKPASQ